MAQDTTDGKKPTTKDKYKRVPEGERVLVELDINDKATTPASPYATGSAPAKILSRVKEGTAQVLGLKVVTELVKGKGKAYLRGAKGTKSYTLFLKQETEVGGAKVWTLALPVPGVVSVAEFYAYAKSKLAGKITGFRTPWGVSYRFGIDTSDDK